MNKDILKYLNIEKNKIEFPNANLDKITYGSNQKLYFTCPICGTDILTTPHKYSNCNPCPVCNGKQVKIGYNDLQSKYPDIAKEWDYEKNYPLKPSEITYKTVNKYYFICHKCGMSYLTSVNIRINGHGCPYCSGKYPIPGKTDLETYIKNHPEYQFILDEWDYEKNTVTPKNVTPKSHFKFNFVCKLGHKFSMRLYNRYEFQGCPYCSHQKVLPGFNDLETYVKNYPDFQYILDEWDYKNNLILPSNILPKSHIKYNWICPKCGNSYSATPANRLTNYTNCPNCNHHSSLPELTLFKALQQLDSEILSGSRQYGFEYDIFLPKYNLGIEYDGSYRHNNSEDSLRRERLKNESSKMHNIVLVRLKEKDISINISDDENNFVYYVDFVKI